MPIEVNLYPGWPLPSEDYSDLIQMISHRSSTHSSVIVAHSLGALQALRVQEPLPTFLLAPSDPARRRLGRPLIRFLLGVFSVAPFNDFAAELLRDRTYRRFGTVPQSGAAISLRDARERLKTVRTANLAVKSDSIVVICSREDPRHPSQTRLARRLGARVYWVDGGHLFPITNPIAVAALIQKLIPQTF